MSDQNNKPSSAAQPSPLGAEGMAGGEHVGTLFNVYPLNDVTIVRAKDSYVWDDAGVQYLDMYGGHAVISIGHTHPHWVKRIEDQLNSIAFYSNSVKLPIQQELADKLVKVSGKTDY